MSFVLEGRKRALSLPSSTIGSIHKLGSSDYNYAGVALDGHFAVAGAPWSSSNDPAAFVFEFSQGSWTEVAMLVPSDGGLDDAFGSSVDISGLTAIVGAYGHNSYRGAVYIFVRETDGSWTEQAKIIARDGASDDYFGKSVAVSADILVVGAHGRDIPYSNCGAAYIFTRSGVVWTEQKVLTTTDCTDIDFDFGYDVDVDASSNFGNNVATVVLTMPG